LAIGRFLENLFFSRKYSRNQIKCEKSKHINECNNICVVVMFTLVLTPCIAYMYVDKKLRYCYILIELLVWPLESLRRTWFSIPTWTARASVSLVSRGITIPSHMALAAAQAAELVSKLKALKGFLGLPLALAPAAGDGGSSAKLAGSDLCILALGHMK